jgi:hypothetical protein
MTDMIQLVDYIIICRCLEIGCGEIFWQHLREHAVAEYINDGRLPKDIIRFPDPA